MASTASDSVVLARWGNPWVFPPLLFLVLGIPVFMVAILGGPVLGQSLSTFPPAAFIQIVFPPLFILELIVILVAAFRHPSRLWRRVELTSKLLRLPDEKHRRVPVDQVTGVGLIKGQRSGWALAVWTADGAFTRIGGMGLATTKADPAGTRAAIAASQLYERLRSLQGETGPLAGEAAQRKAHFSRWGPYRQVWDPELRYVLRDS